jgi:AraC-like DNA-binding protein
MSTLEFRARLVDDPRSVRDFMRVHRSLELPGFELEQESALFHFLAQLVARHGVESGVVSRDGNEDVAVRRARQFLEAHYADRVRLSDLARLTRVSPFPLNRSFCRRLGMPPHAYQTQLRIAQAKRHLRDGRSVSDTACLVGFFDQSHFVHAFKGSEGITPGQYVRESKNLQDGRGHTCYVGRQSK